jgi:hypothetical protein
LFLASVTNECGLSGQARRIQQHVANEAASSSHRWQAQQALERSYGKGPAQSSSASSPAEKSELGSLFQMPEWD